MGYNYCNTKNAPKMGAW